MRILISGASGFLGKEIIEELGGNHTVHSIGRHDSADIIADITEPFEVSSEYDMIVHAAGKAHSIPRTTSEENQFYKVNVDGTKNFLKAISNNFSGSFVFISTVAVYGLDKGEQIREINPMNPKTPYAISKMQAEQEVISWCKNNDSNYVILRLPLIAGKQAPGNLKQMINAIRKGYYFRIGTGSARKSVVGAKSIAQFIPSLIDKRGVYNLTDGIDPSLAEIESTISNQLQKPIRQLPEWFVQLIAKVGDIVTKFPINTEKHAKLTSTLTFDDTLARKELGWNPKPALDYLVATNED